MCANVYISEICGLCYGSNNAISKTRESLKENKNIVIYKEILHNKNVIKELENNGATIKDNLEEISPNDYVIVRAHGEPFSTFEYFENNNIKYLDCTCPNVKAINHLVKAKEKDGFKIIIIGKHNHPEVIGTAGWCNSPFVIEEEKELTNIDFKNDKYYLVVQTTFSKDKAFELIEKITTLMNKSNKIFEYKNTICNAQKNINKASEELASKVDVMIVIGGKNSSNSKELFNNVNNIVKSYFIESPFDIVTLINENKILKNQKIGITAGASTMKEDILKTKELIENNLV